VQPFFYEELERLMLKLRSSWDIPVSTLLKFYGKVADLYEQFELEKQFGPIEKYCDLRKLISVNRTTPHILIAFYGFIPGGGENFPIHLAAGLHKQGWRVSALIFDGKRVNAAMRASLDPAIAIYDAAWIDEYGADQFLADAGISLVHSHNITSEISFFQTWNTKQSMGYLVTLHGSYEDHGLSEELLGKLKQGVDHFAYTADKNLDPLAPLRLASSQVTKLANSLPIDPEPFEKTRRELGIAENAIVFTLVARGVIRKGWRASVEAFLELRKRYPSRPMHLLLCGTGDEPDRLKAIHGNDPDITFLGYQLRIHGLYRMTDVAIVPTRFAGESFPLCILQSLQVGVPVIATRIGEIPNMLTYTNNEVAGALIDVVRDTDEFVGYLVAAMEDMLDDKTRAHAAAVASELGKTYDMDKLVETYGDLYQSILSERPARLAISQ
jgi:glycosyltransferase involved in cell wall biosynthesis